MTAKGYRWRPDEKKYIEKVLLRMKNPSEVLTLGQLSALTKVCSTTIRNKWIKTGKLPCHFIPGSSDRRFLVRNVLAFIKEHNLESAMLLLQESKYQILEYGLESRASEKLKGEVEGAGGCYEQATNRFGFGIKLATVRYNLLVVGGMSGDQVDDLLRELDLLHHHAKVIVVDGPEGYMKGRFKETKAVLGVVEDGDVYGPLFDKVLELVNRG